mmetsp:Transcript_48521/g.141313  ORF Transcript_48521/g.141313 Transcript_48521/m.141313 type:complete len:446 (+) Transcript_48521:66-1403(+)
MCITDKKSFCSMTPLSPVHENEPSMRKRRSLESMRSASTAYNSPKSDKVSPRAPPKEGGEKSHGAGTDEGAVALSRPWWAWPVQRAGATVEARLPREQPDVVPIRGGLVTISGAALTTGLPVDLRGMTVHLPAGASKVEDGVTYFAVDVRPGSGGATWRVWRRYNEFRALAKRAAAGGMCSDARRHRAQLKASPAKRFMPASRSTTPCASFASSLARSEGCPSESDESEFMYCEAAPDVLDGRLGSWSLGCADAPFPRRHFRLGNEGLAEERRRHLEAWLQRMLDVAQVMLPGLQRRTIGIDSLAIVGTCGRLGRVVEIDPVDKVYTYRVEFVDGEAPEEDWYPKESVFKLPAPWRPWMTDLTLFLSSGRTTRPRRCPHKPRSTWREEPVYLEVQVPANSGPGEQLEVVLPWGRSLNVSVPSGAKAGHLLGMWHDAETDTLAIAA